MTSSVPTLTTRQMIEVDRLMIDVYGIELKQMMENAGRCLAILALDQFLGGDATNKKITILAGTGGNGGGVLVAARRLHCWGAKVSVFISKASEHFSPVAKHQLAILQKLTIPIGLADNIPEGTDADLIIDGIIGYSVQGDPRGEVKLLIDWANKQQVSVLSLDTPSGLDLTSGTIHLPTVKANATLTLALPKQGLMMERARELVGDLYLGDISVPPELYAETSLQIKGTEQLFRKGDILRLYTT